MSGDQVNGSIKNQYHIVKIVYVKSVEYYMRPGPGCVRLNSIYAVCFIDRFRNGNILDKEEYNNNETLVLRKVGKTMAGDFRCRAVNEFGAEFSEPAALIVLGKCLYTFLNETLLRISLFTRSAPLQWFGRIKRALRIN